MADPSGRADNGDIVAVADPSGRVDNGDIANWQSDEGDSKDTWDVTVRLDRFDRCVKCKFGYDVTYWLSV